MKTDILLTEEVLLKYGFSEVKTGKGMYGKIYAYPYLDTQYCLESDYNEQPSYFISIEYTDSPFPIDRNVSYIFGDKIKYLSQLQKILFLLEGIKLHKITKNNSQLPTS